MQECITTWKEVKKYDTTFIENKIHEYYNTISSTIHSYQRFFTSHHAPTSTPKNMSTLKYTPTPISKQLAGFIDTITIQRNAKSQLDAAKKINLIVKNLAECQQMVEITTDDSLKVVLTNKIIEEQKTLLKQ